MCGRYALGGMNSTQVSQLLLSQYSAFAKSQSPEELEFESQIANSEGKEPEIASKLNQTFEAQNWVGKYNTSPRSKGLIVYGNKKKDQEYVLDRAGYGLIASWTKEPPTVLPTTINARSDTIASGEGAWKNLRQNSRCIVLTLGYYEWKKSGTNKIPHFFKRKDGKMMLLAGMYDTCYFKGNFDMERTFTIMTCAPTPQCLFYHDRMPVILENEDVELWLSDANYDGIKHLIRTTSQQLEIYKVPVEVGNVKKESPEFIRPISEKKGTIASMFANSPTKPKTESFNFSSSASASASTSESTQLQQQERTPSPTSFSQLAPNPSQNSKSPELRKKVKSSVDSSVKRKLQEKKEVEEEKAEDSDSSIEVISVKKAKKDD